MPGFLRTTSFRRIGAQAARQKHAFLTPSVANGGWPEACGSSRGAAPKPHCHFIKEYGHLPGCKSYASLPEPEAQQVPHPNLCRRGTSAVAYCSSSYPHRRRARYHLDPRRPRGAPGRLDCRRICGKARSCISARPRSGSSAAPTSPARSPVPCCSAT
jgi:hypothetical protein